MIYLVSVQNKVTFPKSFLKMKYRSIKFQILPFILHFKSFLPKAAFNSHTAPKGTSIKRSVPSPSTSVHSRNTNFPRTPWFYP